MDGFIRFGPGGAGGGGAGGARSAAAGAASSSSSSSSAAAGAKRTVAAVEEYAWERTYERTWESIQEDESGLLKMDAAADRRRAAAAAAAAAIGGGVGAGAGGLSAVQRGMLRNVFLVLDLSAAMSVTDLKPNRAVAVAKAVADFIPEYFDQNPISQLGLIVTRNAVAEKLTDLSGNPRRHLTAATDALKAANAIDGDMSLQNALDIALRTLSLQPAFGTREVVLVHGAHASRDPGAISDTIALLKKERVRVSVISLPGEVYLPGRIARETGGAYSVPETFDALRAQLLAHCQPPPRRKEDAAAEAGVKMVRVGFPELVQEKEGLCTCHRALQPRAYVCPQCSARACEIPTECAVCRLQLVSAPGLARSYHHLFPVPLFVEVPSAHEPGYLPPIAVSRGGGEGAGKEGEEKGRVKGSGAAASSSSSSAAAAAAMQDVDDGEEDDAAGGRASSSSSSSSAAAAASSSSSSSRLPLHNTADTCAACLCALDEAAPRYVCPDCRLAYCGDCDMVIHETLHNCPGCVGL
jgi:transcription initiation factor TFIIH subunit 2